jgi:hypothetical protein
MRALATRELTVATRTAAVPLAAIAILAVSTAFVLVWTPGITTLAPLTLYEQARAVHWTTLAVILPWTAVRCSPVDRTEAVVLMAGLIRAQAGTATAAKVIGAFAVQIAVVLTGLPAMVLAQQAAAAPMVRVFTDLIPLFGLALLVAAASTASILFAADGLRAWLWASVIVFGMMLLAINWTPQLSRVGWLCATAGIVGTAGLCAAVRRSAARAGRG